MHVTEEWEPEPEERGDEDAPVGASPAGDSGARPRQRRSQAERAQATRTALVAAGRRLFGERGYADVGAEEIVADAGLTRGALYHHFGGKAELLEAVYEQIEAETAQRLATVVLGSQLTSPMAAMRAGIEVFLEACTEPEVQRIALRDAPAVLGWQRWREIAAANGLGLIEASLRAAIEAGELRPLPVGPLAHLLLGALDEAAMLVADDDDPARRAEVTTTLIALVEGFALRSPPSA